MNRKEFKIDIKSISVKELNAEYQLAKKNDNQHDIKVIDIEIKRRRKNILKY